MKKENSSGTSWDLVVDDIINIAPDTNTSVIKSTQVAPELWINSVAEIKPLQKAMQEGRLFSQPMMAPYTDLGEGWWVTPDTLKRNPQFRTVLDILERI